MASVSLHSYRAPCNVQSLTFHQSWNHTSPTFEYKKMPHIHKTPPPPSSEAKNKKERFIILAVRSVGRIQVHKARENTNGTFSVGKVWPFEDVQAVESYSSREPQNAQEAQAIQWAGESGFTVTIGKPYFWQASSAKEKEFFIASLIKIYRKYTQGQLPELTGFSPIRTGAGAGPGQYGLSRWRPSVCGNAPSPTWKGRPSQPRNSSTSTYSFS